MGGFGSESPHENVRPFQWRVFNIEGVLVVVKEAAGSLATESFNCVGAMDTVGADILTRKAGRGSPLEVPMIAHSG